MIVDFDPVAFRIFGWPIHWYGLMYLCAFTVGWMLARYRSAREGSGWSFIQVDDLLFYTGMGAILGGRVGYTLFYGFSDWLDDPISILRIWEGGMSFHGGLLGVLFGMWLLSRRHNKPYFVVVDFLAPFIPIGIVTVRFGNFINGELWGKTSDLPWAMIFPASGSYEPRHPSPLYQMLGEGLLVFIVLWIFSSKPRPMMAVSGVFAVGYGIARFMAEFVRLPDAHIGYLAFGWVTLGQVLTIPMIMAGLFVLWLAYRPAKN